jgi:hypothetical protein
MYQALIGSSQHSPKRRLSGADLPKVLTMMSQRIRLTVAKFVVYEWYACLHEYEQIEKTASLIMVSIRKFESREG